MAWYQWAAGKGGWEWQGPWADLLEAQSSLCRTGLVTVLVAAIAINGHENSSKYFLCAYITTSRFQFQERVSA